MGHSVTDPWEGLYVCSNFQSSPWLYKAGTVIVTHGGAPALISGDSIGR